MKNQDFTYHCHSDLSDGKNSVEEMIKQAEDIGFSEIGISDHLICHPNAPHTMPMFLHDYDKGLDAYKRIAAHIREAGAKSKIKVHLGFEVDFFTSAAWRNWFEKTIKDLDFDYLIGSVHLARDEKEQNMHQFNLVEKSLDKETADNYLKIHWKNLEEAINSGYFSFIAHLNVCDRNQLCVDSCWNEDKQRVIDALIKRKQPYELNTSGYRKINEPLPSVWMLKELQKGGVPVILNDDAHSVNQLGSHFEEAGKLLAELNYTNRWKPIV